jgi:hypothetical protein
MQQDLTVFARFGIVILILFPGFIMNMKRILLLSFAILLAGCTTDYATSVTSTSAQLNGRGTCDPAAGCYGWFSIKGGTQYPSWTKVGIGGPSPAGTTGHDDHVVMSLTPSTTYEFKYCGRDERESTSTEHCGDIHNFRTLPSTATSLNVTAYGATPNDATDDTAAFNSALAAGKTQGKAVYVPAGTFKQAGVITVDSTELFGAGPSSIIDAITPGASTVMLKGTSPRLRNMKLIYLQPDSGTSCPAGSVHRVNAGSATNFEIAYLEVRGAACMGIASQATASDGVVHDNWVHDTWRDGIHMRKANNMQVIHNKVERAGDDSIAISGEGGTMVNPNPGPVPFSNYIHNAKVFDNIILDNVWGKSFNIAAVETAEFKGNYMRQAKQPPFKGTSPLEWRWSCAGIESSTHWNQQESRNVNFHDNIGINCGSMHPDYASWGRYSVNLHADQWGHGPLTIVNNKFWNNNGLGSVGDGGPVFTTNPAPTISGNAP